MLQDEPSALTRIAPGTSVDLGRPASRRSKAGIPKRCTRIARCSTRRAAASRKTSIRRFTGNSFTTCRTRGRTARTVTQRRSSNAKPRRGATTVARRCTSIPAGTPTFASFLWGEKWLGPRKQFIDEMRTKYGLKVSLHTPLASWMSHVELSSGWGPAPCRAIRKRHGGFRRPVTPAVAIWSLPCATGVATWPCRRRPRPMPRRSSTTARCRSIRSHTSTTAGTATTRVGSRPNCPPGSRSTSERSMKSLKSA